MLKLLSKKEKQYNFTISIRKQSSHYFTCSLCLTPEFRSEELLKQYKDPFVTNIADSC